MARNRNRQTKVTLIAEVSDYVNGMAAASKKTKELGSEAEKLAQKKQAIESVGTGMLAVGSLAAVGVGLAVARFAEFDEAISSVKANTQESTENMALLRQAALDFGASSVFTATESANAIEELGKAGISTADILGGALAGSLELAASGQLEIARAAEISATTLQQFNLEGDQAGRVADVLSAGAGKALGSVDDLANGLKFVGPVASSMNVSLEETVGTLAAFAQAGIVGEQGGTSLRGMLSALTSPSKQAAKEIADLGIQLYDAGGNFLGLQNAAGELQRAYRDLTPQQRDVSLGMLFGNETVTAARVLYREGASGVREWTEAVDDSGYAGQVARDRLDNLRGDVEKLGGAFDTVLIQTGSGANDALRGLVQTAEFLVSAVGDAPQPILDVGLALGVTAGAIGLVGGAALVGIPKVAAFKANLDALNVSGRKAAVGVGLVGGAVAGATLALGYFVTQQADIKATTDTLVDTLDEATGAFTNYTRQAIAKKLADEGAFEAAREAGISQSELTDAVMAGGDALEEVQRKLSGNNTIATFFSGVGIRAGNASTSIRNLRTAIDDSEQSFTDQKAANEESAEAAEGTAAAMTLQADGTLAAAAATGELTDAEKDRQDLYAGADEDFISFGEAMGVVQEQQRALAEQTAEDTESSKDSWEDYYDGVAVSTAGVLEELRKQVEAQTNWESNMLALSGRVSQGVLDDLAAMGPEGAPLVQAFVSATDEELAEMEGLWQERSAEATTAFADNLTTNTPVMRALAEKIGSEAAAGIAAQLQAGTTTVGQIVAEYALEVEGFEPEVKVNTGAAAEELRRLQMQMNSLTIPTLVVNVDTWAANNKFKALQNGISVPGLADGGAVRGAGGPRDDLVPIMASNGEHMLDAEDVRAMGGHEEVYRFRAELHRKPRMRAYRDGGAIEYAQQPLIIQAETTAAAPAGAAPLIGGDLVMQSTGDTRRDSDGVVFTLRTLQLGGRG